MGGQWDRAPLFLPKEMLLKIPKEFEKHAGLMKVLSKYPLDREIGCGAFKRVFKSGDLAICITRAVFQAEREIKMLNILKSFGLPVVQVKKFIKVGMFGVLIMKLYCHPKTATKKIKQDCEAISKVLNKYRVYVIDLQVLLSSTGNVVIADPLHMWRKTKDDIQRFCLRDCGKIDDKYYDIYLKMKNGKCISEIVVK